MPDFDSIGWYGQAMASLAAAMVLGKLRHATVGGSAGNFLNACTKSPVAIPREILNQKHTSLDTAGCSCAYPLRPHPVFEDAKVWVNGRAA